MSTKLFDLSGRIALVTGASHGLGMAMAKGLGHAGATIIVNNHTPDALQAAVDDYKKDGITAYGYGFDVTNDKEVEAAIKKIESEVGPIGILTEFGRDTVGAYAAAKGGLKMLTKSMATEWARFNIQTNGIGPGYFATTQTEPIRVEGHPFNEFIISRTPAGRWGDPEDLQGTAVFLASKASDFVNGQIIYVDGGILATIGKPSNEK